MNFGKYGKVRWINLMKKVSKYGKFQDLQVQDNICEKKFKDIDYFSFVHLIVNYVSLTFIQSNIKSINILTYKYTTVNDK